MNPSFFIIHVSHPYDKVQTKDDQFPIHKSVKRDYLVPNLEYILLLLLASSLPQLDHFPAYNYELPAHIEDFKNKMTFPRILFGLAQRQYSKESL